MSAKEVKNAPNEKPGKPRRTITVTRPGWKPQISDYQLTQYRNFTSDGVEQTLGDPAKVIQVDGVYQITFDTQTQIGNTAITHWPNRFSDPDISFDVTN